MGAMPAVLMPVKSRQPAPVVLRLERQAVILDAGIEAHHLVVHRFDRDARTKEIGREDDAAVGQSDLAVLDRVRAGLLLFVFEAVGVSARRAWWRPSGDRRSRRRSRTDRTLLSWAATAAMKDCVSSLLSSCVALTPRTLRLFPIIAMYLSLRGDLAFEPHAVRVRASEELVGGQAVVDAEPVRELPLGAPHGRQRRDADSRASRNG